MMIFHEPVIFVINGFQESMVFRNQRFSGIIDFQESVIFASAGGYK